MRQITFGVVVLVSQITDEYVSGAETVRGMRRTHVHRRQHLRPVDTLQEKCICSKLNTCELMDDRMNWRMNEWKKELVNEWTNKWMNEWLDRWMVGRVVDGWMNEWTNGWMNELSLDVKRVPCFTALLRNDNIQLNPEVMSYLLCFSITLKFGCRISCLIAHSNTQSCGFEILRDYTINRHRTIGYEMPSVPYEDEAFVGLWSCRRCKYDHCPSTAAPCDCDGTWDLHDNWSKRSIQNGATRHQHAACGYDAAPRSDITTFSYKCNFVDENGQFRYIF